MSHIDSYHGWILCGNSLLPYSHNLMIILKKTFVLNGQCDNFTQYNAIIDISVERANEASKRITEGAISWEGKWISIFV